MTVARNLRFIAIIYLVLNNLMVLAVFGGNAQQNVCLTEKCIRATADILQKIDKTVDPCDDFYKFACGNFVKNVIAPDHKVFASSDLSDKMMLQFSNLFDEPTRDDDSKAWKILKTIYNSCMDTPRIEQEGLDVLKKELKNLGGWPLIEQHWNEDNFDWKIFKQDLRKTFFFSVYVSSDLKNSSKTILSITQISRDYNNLSEGLNNTVVKARYDYVMELAALFGADRETATSDMTDVINFEIDLARIVVTNKEEREKFLLDYNPVTIRELEKNFSNIPWLQSINNYLPPADQMTLDDVVNFKAPKFFERLNTLLVYTKKRTLANYMFTQLAKDASDYLPEVFRQKKAEYLTNTFAKDVSTPRWKHCVWTALALKNIAVSSVYLKHLCYKDIKNIAKELTIDIKSSLLDILKEISWMDRKTRKNAVFKAEMMSFFVYPDEILDDEKVNDYYKELELDRNGSYYRISLNVSNFLYMKDIQELKKPINKPDWKARSYTSYKVNYIQKENSFELPAAVIQEYFDPERPQYMNYGALGPVIGHEVTHGFDKDGQQYDRDGNSTAWWDSETNINFNRESQCFVAQYHNYTIPEIEMDVATSHCYPSESNTLADHVADNGGIKIAYRGYMKWLDRNEPELLLPGLPYTQRQLFWISAASNWCSTYKKEAYRQINHSGESLYKYFRVVLPFMNSEYFGKDFNCSLGSPMNPVNKCHVW